jgi:hypothetical protein
MSAFRGKSEVRVGQFDFRCGPKADIDLPRHAKNLALYCSTVEHHEIAQISSE